jgi:hypothetical protein
MTASPARLHASYPSPDEQWRVDIFIHECIQLEGLDPAISAEAYAVELLRLVNLQSGAEDVVDTQYLSCGGLGAAGLDGRFWSPNSQYFYYTNAREGVPDGLCSYWQPPLRRLSVTSAEFEELGMGPRSPDGGRLATWQGSDLVVWSLDEGEIFRAPLEPSDAVPGEIAWSPNGESLVFLQTDQYCSLAGNSMVVRISFPEPEPEILLQSTEPFFLGVTWNEPGALLLTDAQGNAWRYDLVTEDLEAAP